jgi:hypothetical protein
MRLPFRSSEREGSSNVRDISKIAPTRKLTQAVEHFALRVVSFESLQHIVSCRKMAKWFLSRQRFISIMATSTMASICLAVMVAKAQEVPGDYLNTAKHLDGQLSIEEVRAPHLRLGMTDPDFEHLQAPGTSRDPLTNRPPTSASSRDIEPALAANDAAAFNRPIPSKLHVSLTEEPIENVSSYGSTRNSASAVLSANPRGAEFSSLAALASTPLPSLLHRTQTKYASLGSGQTDSSLPSNDSSAVVYQLGRVNIVVNQLPDSFSLGHTMSGTR